MAQHMVSAQLDYTVVDKRKVAKATGANPGDPFTHETTPPTVFTANGAGSTTTIVGANAAPGTNDNNVIRRGEKFRLFASGAIVPKEETIFTVTTIAVAGSTTVTFTPAALGATASGDFARLVDSDAYSDISSLDAALLVINGGASYTAARLNSMNTNDKIFALRQETDKDSI